MMRNEYKKQSLTCSSTSIKQFQLWLSTLYFQSFPTNFKVPEIKMTVTTFFYYNWFVKFTTTCILKQIVYFYIKIYFILLLNMQAIRPPIKKKIFEIEFISFQTSS